MAEASATSRILTLVFTDLAGSTALKAERGDQVGGALIERHRAIVRRLAEQSGGRIIDWAGDGCFLTFETPSAAVAFALHLQVAHREAPDLPGVRTGIHLGEVGEQGPVGDGPPRVEGLAVDLAARIAGLARPGQILVSAAVANSARQRLDAGQFRRPVRWETYAPYLLKGFDEPLEIREVGLEGVSEFSAPAAGEKAAPLLRPPVPERRRWRAATVVAIVVVIAAGYLMWSGARNLPDVSGAAGTDATTRLDFGSRPAIAVLPFDNLSADPDHAFFADGLAEDLITRLSAWRAFPVIARNSSFQYRGNEVNLRQASSDLGARYVVTGSVRRSGDRIRVAAQLVDAASGEQVWAKSYDRRVADLFTLQDEISSTIAASLVGDLTRAEGERARQQGTEDLEAWSLYQLGLQRIVRYTVEDWSNGARFFRRATEVDPHFATAWAWLALTRWATVSGDGRSATDEEIANTLAKARRAFDLDPRDAVAHAALAATYLMAGDPENALDSARRAVALNPSMPEAWIWLGWSQLLAGDPEACMAATERARRLIPRVPMVWIHDSLALANWETGRYEASLEDARRLIALEPTYFPGYLYIAMSSVSLGRIDEARAAIEDGRKVRPDLSIELMQNYLAVSRPEVDARRNAALRTAGLQ